MKTKSFLPKSTNYICYTKSFRVLIWRFCWQKFSCWLRDTRKQITHKIVILDFFLSRKTVKKKLVNQWTRIFSRIFHLRNVFYKTNRKQILRVKVDRNFFRTIFSSRKRCEKWNLTTEKGWLGKKLFSIICRTKITFLENYNTKKENTTHLANFHLHFGGWTKNSVSTRH